MNPPRQISPEEESLTAEIQKNLKNEEVVIETFDTKQAFVPKVKIFLRGNALLILTMVGIVAGFALGFGIRELDPSRGALMWLGRFPDSSRRWMSLVMTAWKEGVVARACDVEGIN